MRFVKCDGYNIEQLGIVRFQVFKPYEETIL